MQVIAHNMLSQFTERQLNITDKNKSKSTEKLSSGYRINRAGDDAAGLAISEKMRWQVRGLKRGQQNIQDGVSWLQVADGSMEEISKIIHRIRELSVQASNDTNTQSDRASIDTEIKELKKEINNISRNTEFNTQDIFDNSYVSMDIFGMPGDLQIFDAAYDHVTGDVTYGGFVFHGERYTWDTVAPGMVSVDAATGKQVFAGGEYSYTDANGNYFNISCKPGDEVPTISRTLEFSATSQGIVIDGKTMDWSNVIDEDGYPFSSSNIHGGAWSLDYMGATIAFFVGDIQTLDDMVDSINSCNDGKVAYTWTTEFTGTKDVTAVDAQVMKNLQISNSFAANLTSGDKVAYTVRAANGGAQNGIWLENSNGAMVNGSFKSWADLGITSWNSGTDISSQIKYTYADNEGVNDTYISFDFYLSDITSADSVIDGLDGMVISGENIRTNYSTNVGADLIGNVQKVTSSAKNPITFDEEKALGRDFEQQKIDAFQKENIKYNDANHTAEVSFKDSAGNAVLTYGTDTAGNENRLDRDLKTYAAYVLQQKQMLALSGKDPQGADIQLGSGSLTDLVGAGNITTSGHFSETVTIRPGMDLSDGNGYFQLGEAGKTYPAASIDFYGLGTAYTIDSLLGLGFNSTCKTCNNHYSVLFTEGSADSVSGGGYAYSFQKQGNQDYLLQIDINSLKANGVTSGSDLAKAIVDITTDCFDFHYTQYAADGNKLWVYDDRTQNTGTTSATFDTAPLYSIDTDIFDFSLETGDGRSIDVSYTYNYGDIAESIVVEMQQNAQGNYIKDNNGSYILYDNTDPAHAGADRYDMNVSYKSADKTQTLSNISETVESYKQFAMEDMLTNTSVQLDVNDYTYMDMARDENKNVAIQAIFDSKLVETPIDNGLDIQNSSLVGDKTTIPRFPMNTVVLRLYRAGTKTFEEAQASIEYCDYAMDMLLSKRSLYGAYQNRLEHTDKIKAIEEENAQAAESRIRDADMAAEMVNHSKHSILQQAGQSMLSQANQMPNGVLQLLQ